MLPTRRARCFSFVVKMFKKNLTFIYLLQVIKTRLNLAFWMVQLITWPFDNQTNKCLESGCFQILAISYSGRNCKLCFLTMATDPMGTCCCCSSLDMEASGMDWVTSGSGDCPRPETEIDTSWDDEDRETICGTTAALPRDPSSWKKNWKIQIKEICFFLKHWVNRLINFTVFKW